MKLLRLKIAPVNNTITHDGFLYNLARNIWIKLYLIKDIKG